MKTDQSGKTDAPENATSACAEGSPAIDRSSDSIQSHTASLRSKLVLSLAAVFLLILLVDEWVRWQVIEPEFVALEKAAAVRDTHRVLAALQTEVDYLSLSADYVAARMQSAEQRDGYPLIEASEAEHAATRRIDLAVVIDRDGRLRQIETRTPDSQPEPPLVADDFARLIETACPSDESHQHGITRLANNELFMFALVKLESPGPSQQIDGLQRVDGAVQAEQLLLARKIDQPLLDLLRDRTQVGFSLEPPSAAAASFFSRRFIGRGKEIAVWDADPATLVAKASLTDVLDRPLANIYVNVPRQIAARSQRAITLARNSFVIGSVAALLLLLCLLQRIVIHPLTAIRRHSDQIAETGIATEALVVPSNDEIGQLATAFDKMMNRLFETQEQLSRASQAAGRSEVASTVIHNVGNVLTNVNSLIDAAGQRTLSLRIMPLNKLALRLRDASDDDGLLEATPDYLENLAGSLAADKQSIFELLKTLDDNVQHIHDIIQAQRQYTGHDLKPTRIRLGEVIDEAIACCRARLREDSIEVSISGSLGRRVRSDRSLILQTVINLITNARHAMRDCPDSARHLSIEITPIDDHVQIAFRDSGCGMSPETLRQVFDAHFTTRENGSGLGLHFCANTLKRLGGSISASSAGTDCGATFTIFLPHTISTAERTSPEVTESNIK